MADFGLDKKAPRTSDFAVRGHHRGGQYAHASVTVASNILETLSIRH